MDKIIKRIYIKALAVLESPAIITAGENLNTDKDINIDKKGNAVIQGTALAGIFRQYLAGSCKIKDEPPELKELFGNDHSRTADSTLSNIYISDSYITSPKIGKRDGVKLELFNKIAVDQSKYDYEILYPGQKFDIKIEVIIREKHEKYEQAFRNYLAQLLDGLKNSKISIGAKTSRGFGKIKIGENQSITVLDMNKKQDIETWINFDWKTFPSNTTLANLGTAVQHEQYITIETELLIEKTLMIRSYAQDPNEESDYRHITEEGKGIIPGTSWAGAFRHHIAKLLLDLNTTDYEKIIEELFGFVDEKTKTARRSSIIFEESKITQAKSLYMTRVKIDRFTSGAYDSALFNENPNIKGKTKLTIKVRKDKEKYIGLIIMAIQDLKHGIMSLGGETSIGRGTFTTTEDSKLTIDGEFIGKEKETEYLQQAAELIMTAQEA
jgi:CRISPR/Cas system CSM-associated protein Csm3 (group 7 of RAMP superfamily)